jgi:urea transport system permease protein
MSSVLRRFLLCLLLAWPLLAVSRSAVADELAALVDRLGSADFAAKAEAIDAIAASGDERAERVLAAMLAGDLQARRGDGRMVIAERKGQVFVLRDPLSGAEIGEAKRTELRQATINNRLRAQLRGALGALTLLSADAGKRAIAADAVFTTRDGVLLPILDKAIARESEAGVRARLERAAAATRLVVAEDPATRAAAAATLARFADQDVRSLLTGRLQTEPNAEARAAIEDALGRIETELALWGVLANVFQGLSLGSVLLLAAVGLAITFGVMGVINMAHGEMVMLGAYATFVVQSLILTYAPNLLDVSVLISIPAAFLVAGAVGILIEQTIIRHLYGRPLETLLATWGLSLILQQAVRSLFGPSNREVISPPWMSGAIEISGGLALTYNRIAIIVFSLAVFAVLTVLIRYSSFGLRIRAVTQNRRMAGSMGIRTQRMDAMTFGLGSGIAGMAGVALSQIDNVSPNLGQGYIIDSFMVVVFGGVGNLMGTLVGALSLGLVNKFLEPHAGAVLGKIIVLVAIILFIQKRPQGIFAPKGRAAEA